ncbi:MAG: EamA family transporter [Nitrospirota bacterium]
MPYLWIVLSLTSAFSLATSDALTKRIITPANEYAIAWLRIVYSLPALAAALAFTPVPSLDATFAVAFCAALPLEIAAILLYYKALRVSPLSLSLPFLSLTPVFLVIFSWIIMGEKVSAAGAAGIALIALGGYGLNLSSLRAGPLGPLKAVLRERGSLYMLAVSLIYSATSALGKLAITHSSPAFFGATYYLALAVCLLPVIVFLAGGRVFFAELRATARAALLPGAFDAVQSVTHFFAVSMANVAYMIAIKRSSLLMGSVYGFLLFGERNVRERLVGSLIMFAGFVVIVVYG